MYLRSLDSEVMQQIGDVDNVRAPFWSPDGRSVGFFASGKLKRISAGGGPTQDLCDSAVEQGGTWNRAGVILFGSSEGPLMRASESGGACMSATKADPGSRHSFPVFLPDGQHFLFLGV